MRYFFVLVLITVAACSNQTNVEGLSGFIQIKGSDTLVNVTQRLAEEFMKDYPYIFVAVTGGGSGVGIASLINGTCDIATASRRMKGEEVRLAKKWGVNPYEFVVGYDGVAIVVNKNNPVNKLTIEELHRIYTGKIKNWKELGGEDLEIVALSREVSSGTHVYFKEEVVQLGDKKNPQEFARRVLLLSSSQAIIEEVASNPQAIGYVGMGYISERIKPLALGENKEYFFPTLENVAKEKYPLSRPLYMYTDGKPEGVTKIFIDFVLSKKGQKQFELTGFVPLGFDETKED